MNPHTDIRYDEYGIYEPTQTDIDLVEYLYNN